MNQTQKLGAVAANKLQHLKFCPLIKFSFMQTGCYSTSEHLTLLWSLVPVAMI